MSKIDKIIEDFHTLTTNQKGQVARIINSVMNNSDYDKGKFTIDLREMRFNKGKVCPKGNSNHVVKNGKFEDKQRYFCKDCRKTCNNFTATPLSISKKRLKGLE